MPNAGRLRRRSGCRQKNSGICKQREPNPNYERMLTTAIRAELVHTCGTCMSMEYARQVWRHVRALGSYQTEHWTLVSCEAHLGDSTEAEAFRRGHEFELECIGATDTEGMGYGEGGSPEAGVYAGMADRQTERHNANQMQAWSMKTMHKQHSLTEAQCTGRRPRQMGV